jgi:transcriptional regulator with XRE-family HTH domain
MATNTNNTVIIAAPEDVGAQLRARRDMLGVSRARLAGLAGCSVSALALIEQGAVPRRSAVLERAFSVLADLEREALQGR